MNPHELDLAVFRAMFPAFADVTAYPDATLQVYWDLAVVYLGAYDTCLLAGPVRQQALYLLMAHLLQLSDMAQAGDTPAIVTMSRIDKVQVQVAEPPVTDGWSYWLATTPYGLQLWALLNLQAAGGFYMNGSPMRSGFRLPDGGFPQWQ